MFINMYTITSNDDYDNNNNNNNNKNNDNNNNNNNNNICNLSRLLAPTPSTSIATFKQVKQGLQ